MPNRTLREGIVSSEGVNRVSEQAELLFYRMLVTADDYGLVEIGAAYLKAKALPARNVSMDDISVRLKELTDPTVGNPLVRKYEVNGKWYGAIANWDQRVYANKPKFPLPPWGKEHIRGGYIDPRARTDEAATVAPDKRKAPDKINGHRRRAPHAWWASEDGIRLKAEELKIAPRAGESWHELKGRINAELENKKGAR